MASIEDQLKNARTMEDIVNLLTILFTNLNNQNEQYYDMFLNPVPMDLDLERYDENGELVTIVHPNVAKMRITAYSGAGNPNGVQAASIGALYIDTVTRNIFYKAVGSDSYGWQLIWSVANLVAGVDYLTPTGNGSQVTNLNMDNASSGVLSVARGGTGVSSINGLVKGNGTEAFAAATANQDYMALNYMEGCVMYWPSEVLPVRSLICDGTLYDISVRPELTRLCNILGSKYGGDGTTTFGVPNLIGKYIKGGLPANVGVKGEAHVGSHSHTGTTANGDKPHTHTRGTMDITGRFAQEMGKNPSFQGAFYRSGTVKNTSSAPGGEDDSLVYFKASRAWTGATSSTSITHKHTFTTDAAGSGTNDVDHVVMVPIIRY
jgi:microcystin-dependent protein